MTAGVVPSRTASMMLSVLTPALMFVSLTSCPFSHVQARRCLGAPGLVSHQGRVVRDAVHALSVAPRHHHRGDPPAVPGVPRRQRCMLQDVILAREFGVVRVRVAVDDCDLDALPGPSTLVHRTGVHHGKAGSDSRTPAGSTSVRPGSVGALWRSIG